MAAMSGPEETKTHCLCGQIKITVPDIRRNVGACHCGTCRKWGGGPFMTVFCGTNLAIEGKEHITVFDSSKWAERGFCRSCGTHLYYRLKGKDQYFVPVGMFDSSEAWDFDHQVFIDEKPNFYCFSNKTEDLTGPEVFAKFAPPAE